MTLVIMFEKAPVVVGDLMASNVDPELFDKYPISVRNKDRTPLYGAYPVQKIVKIRVGVHIACAGGIPDAKKIIKFARDLHWPSIPTGGLGRAEVDATMRPLINEIHKYYDDEGLAPLQLIFSTNGYLCSIGADRLPTPVGPAQVIGSGINDFRKFPQQTHFGKSLMMGSHGGHSPQWSFPEQACISFALSFFATYLSRQAAGIASLRERWGWGMEMLFDWEKIDRILYQGNCSTHPMMRTALI